MRKQNLWLTVIALSTLGLSACSEDNQSSSEDSPCAKCTETEQCVEDQCVPKGDPCAKCTSEEICVNNVCKPRPVIEDPCTKCTSDQVCVNNECRTPEGPCTKCTSDQVCYDNQCLDKCDMTKDFNRCSETGVPQVCMMGGWKDTVPCQTGYTCVDGFCDDPKTPILEDNEVACSDGIDNDENGLTDCQENACKSFANCHEAEAAENTEAACKDGEDNDKNGKIDCADSGCKSFSFCQENTVETCTDKQDNDGDGFLDCDDPDCIGIEACKIVKAECGNGLIEAGESCDGANVGSFTCAGVSLDFVAGSLKCDNACQFDTSGCVECTLKNTSKCAADETCSSEGKCVPATCLEQNIGKIDNCECVEDKHCANRTDGNTSCLNNICVAPRVQECSLAKPCSSDKYCLVDAVDEFNNKCVTRTGCKTNGCTTGGICVGASWNTDGQLLACEYGCAAGACIEKVCDNKTCSADNRSVCIADASDPKGHWNACRADEICSNGTCMPMPSVVISQLYSGGNTNGATFSSKYIELFNRETHDVTLSGWSIQYGSAKNTTIANVCTLPEITLPANRYYLIELSQGTNGGKLNVPVDYTCSKPISTSKTDGKIFLVPNSVKLSSSQPSAESYVDAIGYGNANWAEGEKPAPSIANTKAAWRLKDGCIDSNVNVSDFEAKAPAPRNAASPAKNCSEPQCGDGNIDPGEACEGNAIIDCSTYLGASYTGTITCSGCQYDSSVCTKLTEDTEELCSDGLDNDGNGLIDCMDTSCKKMTVCREDLSANCKDGKDNDLDGLVDCADTGCKTFAHCKEESEKTCKDGIDNDLDGLTDCEDPTCKEFVFCKSQCAANETWLPEHNVCAININSATDFVNLVETWEATGAETESLKSSSGHNAYYLTTSIDLGTWKKNNWALGTFNNHFTGIFDGGSNLIKGTTASSLFGITENATICHLNVDLIATGYTSTNYYYILSSFVDSFSGKMYDVHATSTIDNIQIAYTDDEHNEPMFFNYGGLIAYVSDGSTIENVTFNGNLSFKTYNAFKKAPRVGGLFGYVGDNVKLSNIDANIKLTMNQQHSIINTNEQDSMLSGVLGYLGKNSELNNSKFHVQLTFNDTSALQSFGSINGFISRTNASTIRNIDLSSKCTLTDTGNESINSYYASTFVVVGTGSKIENLNADTTTDITGVSTSYYVYSSFANSTYSSTIANTVSLETSNKAINNAFININNSKIVNSYFNNILSTKDKNNIELSHVYATAPYTCKEACVQNDVTNYVVKDGYIFVGNELLRERLNKNLGKNGGTVSPYLTPGQYRPWIDKKFSSTAWPWIDLSAKESDIVTIQQ